MTAVIRDVAIIVLAVETIVIGVLLALLLWQVRALVVILRDEIQPLLDSAQQTSDTVRATTHFLSKRIVKPGVDALSFGAGLRQAARTLKQRARPSSTPETMPWERDRAARPASAPPPAPPADSGEEL